MQTNEQRKNLRDFARKLRDTNFPFKAFIQKNKTFKRELFCEFLQTVQIPDLFLYRRQFFTDRQINEGFIEANSKIPVSSGEGRVMANLVAMTDFEKTLSQIRTDFYEKIKKNVLEKSYYSFDIEDTATVKNLNQIDHSWSRFSNPTEQDVVNNEKGQYHKYAKAHAVNIADQLKKLMNLELVNEIVIFILEDDTHATILAVNLFPDQTQIKKIRLEKYGSLKILFDRQLKEELSKNAPVIQPVIAVEGKNTGPPQKGGTAQNSGFDTYIVEQYRAKLMPYLIENYSEKKPKTLVPMLYALDALNAITTNVTACDQTNLHKALETSFGSVGGRTALNAALPLYESEKADSAKKQKIEQQKQQIQTFLKKEKLL